MVAHGDSFYGREPVIRFVRDLMAREETGRGLRNRRFPILAVEGSRGTGKTALLLALDTLLDQRVPHALQDFEAIGDASLPQVLSALAFELSEKCHRYGALRFPRFVIGQLVMGLDLDPHDPAEARKQVIEALARRRWVSTVRAMLVEMAGAALKPLVGTSGVPVEPPGKVLWLAVEWLTARAPDRIVLGSFQGWYGHRDLGRTKDSIDVLIRLNKWAKNKDDERSRHLVDELLLAAFLADLRSEFNRGRRADERSLNCVILLDNADADSELGRYFLDQLVQARSQPVEGEQDDGDPLTVVATSRGGLLAGVSSAEWEPVRLDHNTSGERSADALSSRRLGWLRYQLPNLTEVEVGRAVTNSVPATVGNQRLTRVLFQLTNGHPGSLRLVLDALAMNPDPPEDAIDPKAILSQPPSGKNRHRWSTVEDQILDRLLQDASDAESTARDLLACTAARDLPHALWLATQEDLRLSGQVKDLQTLEPILWPTDRTAGPGPTLPRRLLQRRLARRDPASPPSWTPVYHRLRDAPRGENDLVSELYYALAGGELGLVTQRLHYYLTETEFDDQRWLDLLKSVTSAPRQHQQQQALMDEVHTLVHAAALEKSLTSLGWLVAALWICADPFNDSNRGDLHKKIADDYDTVARLTRKGFSVVLRDEADKHRREAAFWGRRK